MKIRADIAFAPISSPRNSDERQRRPPNCYARDVTPTCNAMAHLHGLRFVPVQRNRGIDAIVRAVPGSQPILIRVQRSGELLGDAAQLLHRAGKSKQPAQLILIATEERTSANLFDDLPVDVTIINSTSKEVVQQVAEAQAMNLVRS